VGLPQEDSDIVAEAMLSSNKRGIETHGIRTMPNYIKRFEAKSLNAAPKITPTHETAVSAAIDGDNGLGHVTGTHAMRIAIEKALKSGIGMATVRNSNHFGMTAFFPMMAQAKGLIGIACSNASARMAPTGGKTPIYGNNPWSVALPHSQGKIPVVVDMASSVVANSHVIAARKKGTKIPTHWALTKDGQPTDDPNLAVLLQPFGGHKGYALSLIVEAFAGGLSGSAMGINVKEYNSMTDGQSIGHFLAAIDPGLFMDRQQYVDNIERFFNDVKHSEPIEDGGIVYLPGEKEHLATLRAVEEGLFLEGQDVDDFNQICEKYGVTEKLK